MTVADILRVLSAPESPSLFGARDVLKACAAFQRLPGRLPRVSGNPPPVYALPASVRRP